MSKNGILIVESANKLQLGGHGKVGGGRGSSASPPAANSDDDNRNRGGSYAARFCDRCRRKGA